MSYYRKIILVVLLFIDTSYVSQADEGKAGLPQLDFNTYPSLVFLVCCILNYRLYLDEIFGNSKYKINLKL